MPTSRSAAARPAADASRHSRVFYESDISRPPFSVSGPTRFMRILYSRRNRPPAPPWSVRSEDDCRRWNSFPPSPADVLTRLKVPSGEKEVELIVGQYAAQHGRQLRPPAEKVAREFATALRDARHPAS